MNEIPHLTAQAPAPAAALPVAPAVHVGYQAGFEDLPGFDLFNLTRPVGIYPAGTTLSSHTIINLGFRLP